MFSSDYEALETIVSYLDTPAFASLNPMPLLNPGIEPRIWIGHASNVSAHYDTMDNLACVAAGTRRFTLFAPQLIDKLYVGPIDHTMAGQPVSLAASSAPDKERFPLTMFFAVMVIRWHTCRPNSTACGPLKENYGKIRARVMRFLRGG